MDILNKTISQTLPYVPKPIIGYFAKPYIAGEDLDAAVATVKRLMSEGACATIDVLGEEITDKSQASEAAALYREVLQRIKAEDLHSGVSVKPTHMGLKLDKQFCYENIKSIVQTAKSCDRFVRIDMEDHTTTTDTINMYLQLKQEFNNVGTVLQAYLRRTLDDVNALLPHHPDLRLCKGIYKEAHTIAYHDREIINKNYAYLLEKLLKNGNYVGIATHDEKLVWEALRIIDTYNIPKSQYEFQMLLGVTTHLRDILISAGHKLRVYVPFGKEWKQYSTRHLKENPDIVGHVSKNVIKKMFGKNGAM